MAVISTKLALFPQTNRGYPRLPVYHNDLRDQEASVAMLNQVFHVLFDDMGSWPIIDFVLMNSS